MAIDAKLEKMMNEKMGYAAYLVKLGTVLKDLQDLYDDSEAGGLPGRVGDLETTVGQTAAAGLQKAVADLEGVVGDEHVGLTRDVNSLKTTVGGSGSGLVKGVDDLTTVVGATAEDGLRSDVADIQAAIGTFVVRELVAGAIDGSVATVDTGVDFEAVYSALVTDAAGAVRAVTKVEKGGTDHETEVLLTVTDVAATDIVSVIVK